MRKKSFCKNIYLRAQKYATIIYLLTDSALALRIRPAAHNGLVDLALLCLQMDMKFSFENYSTVTIMGLLNCSQIWVK